MRQLIRSGTKQVPDAELRRIRSPTGLVWGRHDRFVPLAVAEEASARLGWPLHVIDDAGHVPHIEQPEAFLKRSGGIATSARRREMNYRLAYALGFHPWEDLAEHPPFAGKLLELVAREEDGHGPPYGPALDLGTGSGVWGVQLAKRGWSVTGVDIVEKALQPRPRAGRRGRASTCASSTAT